MWELIIFDCDGVLVDSEPIACEVVVNVLARAGFPLTLPEFFTRYAGVSDREMFAHLEKQHRTRIGEDVRRTVSDEILTALTERLEPIPGIHRALEAVEQRKCVASGSGRQRVEASLARTGLLAHFAESIFTSEEVPRGKPAPDLFLHAARQMGVAPRRCLVIEDSEAGVQAAVAAGMRVLGFVGGSHCAPDRSHALLRNGAASVFQIMEELPQRILDV
jgi:HAD superfamily hydrolase (TIGR01509 family)